MKLTGKSPRNRPWAFGIALILVALACAIPAARGNWLKPGYPVKTVVIARGNIQSYITVSGNLISSDEVALVSPASARIVSVDAVEGANGRRDQALLHLDTRELQSRLGERRSALQTALAVRQSARHDWEALQQIYLVGGESSKTVADAKLKWQEATRDVAAIESDISRQQLELERYTVKAPLAGTVTAVQATAGAWVNQGEVLMKMAGSSSREIEIKIDSGDANAVALDKAVTLSSEAYPDAEWSSKISWIAPSTKKDGTSNTLAVRVPLSAQMPAFTLGQQVDVKIPTAMANNVLLVPSAAIFTAQGKSAVAVVENGVVRFRAITLGSAELKTVEVRSGLSAGQVVIIPEGKILKENDKVSAANAGPHPT